MTPHQTARILDTIRARRDISRKKRYRPSKLIRYRAELVALHLAGASYRELAFWLRRDYRLIVDHSTIRRYLIQLPEVIAKEADYAKLSQGC